MRGDRMSRIRSMIGLLLHGAARMDGLAQRVDQVTHRVGETQNTLARMEGQIAEISGAEESFSRRIAQRICRDRDTLTELKAALSRCPVIWGDPERLHIAETAEVGSCFFQTASGTIHVGEYTFAGPGVSLLADEHDPAMKGLPRMEAGQTEGCDIRIGCGVWLGGGCTILGPCEVGDHAVILAGSVVMPGTVIPAGEVWGGVPAVQSGRIDSPGEEEPGQKKLLESVDRLGGMLFLSGWSAAFRGRWKAPARRLVREEGRMLVRGKKWILEYQKEQHRHCELRITGPEGEQTLILTETEGEAMLDLPVAEREAGEISFTFPKEEKLIAAFRPVKQE